MVNVKRKSIGSLKRLKEQSLMLKVRFQLIMVLHHGLPDSNLRLEQTKSELLYQVNAFQPSLWLIENFVNKQGLYAGFFWCFKGQSRSFTLEINQMDKVSKVETQMEVMA